MRIAGSNMQQAIKAETDIFGRDLFAGGLLNLFKNSDDPLVVALDEKWGTGKTVFARRLEKKATDQGFTVIYFDAFKRDYDPDVFIALSAELLTKLPDTDRKKSLKQNAKVVGKTIGKLALKAAVRVGTAGALKAAEFNEAAEQATEELSDMAEAELDKLIDKRLDGARVADETFANFKLSLGRIANGSKEDEPQEAKVLLFIVDELDRCRPDYALSVLETIKHFFSVPNVHFLLVCDIEQLVAAVRYRYGIGGHGYTYLEKFIDIRVHFPTMKDHEQREAVRQFVREFAAGMPPDGENGELWHSMRDFISDLAIANSYSLRRVEKILTQFAVSMLFTNEKQFRLTSIIFILCDLKITNPLLFKKCKTMDLKYSELHEHYNFDEDKYDWYISWLRYFYDETIDRNEPDWIDFGRSIRNYNFRDVDHAANYLANDVVDKIG